MPTMRSATVASLTFGGLIDDSLATLFVDGKLVSTSSSFDPAEYDVSTNQPLRIGFGQTEYFAGKIADVRLYKTSLTPAQIQILCSKRPPRF